MKALIILLALVVAMRPQTIHAQETAVQKTKLNVSADCSDPVGELLIYHLREEIRKSAGYMLDPSAGITLSFVCTDNTVGGTGVATAASLVVTDSFDTKGCTWLWIVQQQILRVGLDQTHTMAARILASIDSKLHQASFMK